MFYFDGTAKLSISNGKETFTITTDPLSVASLMYKIRDMLNSPTWTSIDEDVPNSKEAWTSLLLREGYVKVDGNFDYDIYIVFNGDFPNLLMIELVSCSAGSRHINITINPDEF